MKKEIRPKIVTLFGVLEIIFSVLGLIFSVIGEEWGLGCVAKITSIRKTKTHVSHETRYYISSLTNASSKDMLSIIRAHWKIENSLHWVLDIEYHIYDLYDRTKLNHYFPYTG